LATQRRIQTSGFIRTAGFRIGHTKGFAQPPQLADCEFLRFGQTPGERHAGKPNTICDFFLRQAIRIMRAATSIRR
jgi:hypothetical protein